ncbi:Ger(x)C family spore germination protein [Gracilibacillus massiliensis]|uniref:Ger(x)C family spore germination protein n=1 Tax=Gracilibacillus massiliensis TaxID=1564956 RepID=UPI00071D69A4|nr:Ger(x)C family spore germination protein [Gracilibacillus massiliensis]
MRKLIMILVISVLVLAGCWDVQELTEIGIVTAMAIDIDENTGEYILTSQYLRPSAESTFTSSQDESFLIVAVKGRTISELMRKANHKIDRKAFYAHNKVIVVSEQVAKEGLISLFETFQREQEVRSYVWVAVAQETSAAAIIEKQHNSISKLPANFLYSLFDNAEYDAVADNLLTFYKDALEMGSNPVLGVLTLEKEESKKNLHLSGGAVFKKDKLVGFISNEETMAYNWITNKNENSQIGALTFPYKENDYITLNLTELKSKIVPNVTNKSDISFTIKIKHTVEIAEQQAINNFSQKKDVIQFIEEIEKIAESEIENKLVKVLSRAQKEFQTDIFGFGDILNKKNPVVWNQVKKNWETEFINASFDLDVEVEILNSGLIQGSLEPKQ